jgi:hypothetical protein
MSSLKEMMDCNNENNTTFATITWVADDIIAACKFDISVEDAVSFLSNIEDELEEVTIERGWDFIKSRLNEEDFK